MKLSSNVYLFNPTCEYAVANGNDSWQPNRILQKMESDLGTLPMFFAQQEDLILVDQLPSENFVEQFKKIGFKPPQFVLKKEIQNKEFVKSQTFNKLLPWGWSPAAHKLLTLIKPNCSSEFKNSPVASWTHQHREIYSKAFASNILRNLLDDVESECFISKSLLPEICTTKKHFEKLISRWEKIMVKAPWSSSGRGLQPITKTPVHEKVWEKLLGIVNEQGYAVVEPYLNKVEDMAFQFKINNGKVSFLGVSNFSTDKKGQYIGNFLNGEPETYSMEIKEFIRKSQKIIIPSLIKILEQSDLVKLYEGNFGVDTLIFLDENKRLKINPCMEINVRQNMGLLSLQLEKLIYQNKKGIFKIYYNPDKTFFSFKKEMEKKYTLKIVQNKIDSGFLALTDATSETQFGAYILV